MDIANQLILFAYVVEAGSFIKTADKLGITNSVVSKRIAKLERELGVQLLYRTTRKLSLTQAGELLYQQAKEINTSVEQAVDLVKNISKSLSGTIRISAPTISGQLILGKAIAEFCDLYPQIKVELRLEDQIVDLVKDRIDLAIRTASLADSTLIAKPLVRSDWVVCASPEYLKQHGAPGQPEDLQQHKCLTYTYEESGSKEWLFKQNGEQYTLSLQGGLSSNNQFALRDAALAGFGLIYCPKLLVYQALKAGQLVTVLDEFVAKSLNIYAVYPFTRQLPIRISRLIEHLISCYARQEYQLHN